jgi:hypothetical protein
MWEVEMVKMYLQNKYTKTQQCLPGTDLFTKLYLPGTNVSTKWSVPRTNLNTKKRLPGTKLDSFRLEAFWCLGLFLVDMFQ